MAPATTAPLCPVCNQSFSNFANLKAGTFLNCPACKSSLYFGTKGFKIREVAKESNKTGIPMSLSWIAPPLAIFGAFQLTPELRGPDFLIVLIGVGLVLTGFNIHYMKKYGPMQIFWPFLTFVCFEGTRYIAGTRAGMTKWNVLFGIGFLFSYYTFPIDKKNNSNSGSGGFFDSSCSSCGSSCGGGCGGCGS